MAKTDLSAIGKLFQSLGPTDEHRKKFGRTFLGTLLGQGIVLIGMIVVYFAALATLHRYATNDLKALRLEFGSTLFWIVILAPFACIFLFSMLPTMWRALRERQLRSAIIGGDLQFKPGYFRLYPYGEVDRDSFTRLDGAGIRVVNWIKSAGASLLYMSGPSGVGKSSLLAADVLPKLHDAGWTVLETRLFGDPIKSVRNSVLNAKGLLPRGDFAKLSLRELFEKAIVARSKTKVGPLLFVIDQFEEFLILHDAVERAPFASFLVELIKSPIEGLRVLLVFRSDYQPLIFKLELPPLVSGENWQELSPYDRGEATSFLQSGGRELSVDTLDALFRGLDRIEETPGLYRPITLNMVGLVLERMGRTIEGDPSRLIQRYLAACLTASQSRDFATSLLASMITDAGTKEPRSEAELTKLTQFELWQVKATLSDLARQGLVRRLDGTLPVWEIAHDFLARLIGQMIGRLKPTLFQLVRPFVAPIVLIGWIGLAALALPYWLTAEEQSAQAHLRALGGSIKEGTQNGLLIELHLPENDIRRASAILSSAQPYLEQLSRLTELEIWGPGDIFALRHLTHLKKLRLINAGINAKLEALKDLTSLTDLQITPAYGIPNLKPLANLTALQSIQINYGPLLTSLEGLESLSNLISLELSDCPKISSLTPLRELKKLSKLNLGLGQLSQDSSDHVSSIEPLSGLDALTLLNLGGRKAVTIIEALRGLTQLKFLYLGGTGITSIEPLRALINLERISLASTSISNLDPLVTLEKLKFIDIRHTNLVWSPQMDRLPVRPIVEDNDPRISGRI